MIFTALAFAVALALQATITVRAQQSEILPPHVNSPSPDRGGQLDAETLPPLEEELLLHGGSYLYEAEGDRLAFPCEFDPAHVELLRLPETWRKPRPLECCAEFLGADPILPTPGLRWLGHEGYVWEPRFVGHGGYEMFAFALQENGRRQDVAGHQLILDLDLRLTGTERFHVQYRPLGRRNSGGSFYQFSNPAGYEDNSTGEPDRYWFEAELHSLVGADYDPFAALDYHVTVGRVPLVMHNSLLVNDEMLACIVNKNTLLVGQLSNMNVQAIYGFKDVSTFSDADARMYGAHISADYRRVFYEATYLFVDHDTDSSRDSHFAALSRTKMLGPYSLAARALSKWGDRGGKGDGQLLVLEGNCTRVFDHHPFGVDYGVFYCNAFWFNDGWNSIGGGNFNRLRASLEVNPLVRISALPSFKETWGLVAGAQLFRRHEDESIIPEVAYENRDGEPVIGFGLRYLRKTGPRTYLELLGVASLSGDSRFDREGAFFSHFILF